MKLNNFAKLTIALVASGLAGVVGSFFTSSSVTTWYAALDKPALNPSAWIFGPVWTILYILMGVAAFLVWKKGLTNRDTKIALGIFVFQLILNTFWSIIFFGAHNPGVAFVEILSLWCAILAMVLAFRGLSRAAAYLLLPYLLWVTFAGYLNYSIWQLSGGTMNSVVGASQNIVLPDTSGTTEAVFCTMEAKICPDGSAVGRSGPKCEFAACPETVNGEIWKTFTDVGRGLAFKYPEQLTTEFTRAENWPPKVTVTTGTFSCLETLGTASLPSRTIKRLVDNRSYCVEALSEGAAGSVYTDYLYTTEKDNQLINVNFTLRAVQCSNYDDPQQTACEQERETFDLDAVIDRVVQSVKVD